MNRLSPDGPFSDLSLSTPLLHHPTFNMSDASRGQESSSADDGGTAGREPPASSLPSNPSPASFLSRHGPAAALRFLTRRTSEHRRNASLAELSGSLGDLGTFIPLTVALARERKIALAPALFWAGASNVVTGYAWDVPMCVQPMKSIAAVALTDVAAAGTTAGSGLDAPSVTAAGILTGGAVFLLGVTNLMEVVNWIVPLTVVCGLQIGVGLRLASKGIRDIQQLPWGGGHDCIGLAVACALLSMFWLRDNENGMKRKEGAGDGGGGGSPTNNAGTVANSVAASSDAGIDGTMEMGKMGDAHQLETTAALLNPRAASAAGSATFSTPPSPSPRPSRLSRILKRTCCCLDPFPQTPHPVGIYLFLIGCLFAAVTLATAGPDSGYDLPLRFFGAPVVINAMRDVTALSWRQGLLQGALPQLPLTTLNSVISVCCLAHSLYPEKRDPSLMEKRRTDAVVTRREVSVSVGAMNLLLCPLGSMPNCHGAGGLAGQHRFGARHGTSVVLLGTFKVFLAVFFGASALTLLDALPVAVLGIMLAIAGLELVGTGVAMLFECVKKDEERVQARIGAMDGADGGAVVNSKVILRKNSLISMVTAGVIVALQKTHYGAISGWVVHMVYGDGFRQLLVWANKKRRKRREENLDD